MRMVHDSVACLIQLVQLTAARALRGGSVTEALRAGSIQIQNMQRQHICL